MPASVVENARIRQSLNFKKMLENKKNVIDGLGKVGSAYSEGDCFFDAIAQGLKKANISIPISSSDQDYKKLRLLCRTFAIMNPEFCKEKLKSEHDDYNQYVMNIAWDAREIEREYNAHCTRLSTPIWGRQDVEGVFICKELGIKLHTVELYDLDDEIIVCHQLIDASGSKTISENDIDYHDPKMIHILGHRLHFVPYVPHALECLKELKAEKPQKEILEKKPIEFAIKKVETMPLKKPIHINKDDKSSSQNPWRDVAIGVGAALVVVGLFALTKTVIQSHGIHSPALKI